VTSILQKKRKAPGKLLDERVRAVCLCVLFLGGSVGDRSVRVSVLAIKMMAERFFN
jgi:hypothetical protein